MSITSIPPPGRPPLEVLTVELRPGVGEPLRRILSAWTERVCMRTEPAPEQAIDVIVVVVAQTSDIHPGRTKMLRETGRPWVVYGGQPDIGDAITAIQQGARGCLCAHSAVELIAALERAASGSVLVDPTHAAELLSFASSTGRASPADRWDLRPRHVEVLELLVAGRANREIALELYLSEQTVKSHLRALYRKLGARNRTEAIAIATGRR